MIDIDLLRASELQIQPYPWAAVAPLFSRADGVALATTYPVDHCKTVVGDDGEKTYSYDARNLIPMGEQRLTFPDNLSTAWQALGQDLLSPEYRQAMSMLTGYDLAHIAMEANLYHYSAGAHQGPHCDLPAKLVVHVLYFNQNWVQTDGGCMTILKSANPNDIASELLPNVGNSSVFVRSPHSWHAVQPVKSNAPTSRRSLVVTFYKPGSISTLWPPGENPSLHTYTDPE